MGIQGIFCRNFNSFRGNWTPCRKAWCGDCYTCHLDDSFHIHEPQDEEGFVWKKRGDECRFMGGRDGDHLVTPFQCDLCIFRIHKGRDPRPSSHQDSRLSCCIRRMKLDSSWHMECNTICSHWSAFKLGLKVLERVGIPPPYQNLGPYPLTDTFGYGVALQMLLKSEEAGK